MHRTTALHASHRADARAIMLLRNAKLSEHVNLVSELTPLHLAAYRGHSSVMKFIVTAGCDIDALDSLKRTPLHIGQ